MRVVLVLSASARAFAPSSPRLLPPRLQGREDELTDDEGVGRGSTHLSHVRVVLVLSASARALPPSAPRLLPARLQGRAGEHT